MGWRPGQFIFLSSPEAGLNEPHPFTIASAPNANGSLSLVIKTVGDWTRRLPKVLQEGTTVKVEGPYGRFNFRKGAKRQVWLAGGVGVTPFLAWAESLSAKDQRDIHLIVCVQNDEDQALFLPILQAAHARNSHFSFQVVVSKTQGRLTADRLVETTPFPVGAADLWFCGPSKLRQNILTGLERIGHTPKRVHFEYFEFV